VPGDLRVVTGNLLDEALSVLPPEERVDGVPEQAGLGE
jgi:hypothetical protein